MSDSGMTPAIDPIGVAWLQAAQVLAIEVVAPFTLSWHEEHYRYSALVQGFGRPSGTLTLTLDSYEDEPEVVRTFAVESDYFRSILNPQLYRHFDRHLFERTLNDWGWYGSGEAPTWYTGEPDI
jgi:hypothetical protein